MMDQLNLNAWQMIAAGVLYIAYLCWVMFGGMRKKKIKPVVYIVMTILMFYGLLEPVQYLFMCGFSSIILSITRKKYADILTYGKYF